MKRILVVALLSVSAIVGFGAPASASPRDVDDFNFASFSATYDLSRGADGRAQLKTVETLVAEFPTTNQNHGIRRQLVDRYDGHPTDLSITSVTDDQGKPRAFTTDTDNDFLDVTIKADGFVHGSQTYVISYTQNNVVLFNPGVEDFYWDTNGTGWAQKFLDARATVNIAPDLVPSLTGAVSSVIGFEGQTGNPATLASTPAKYVFDAGSLRAMQNLSFAIGFKPGTFVPRANGFFDSASPSISAFGLLLAIAGLVMSILLRRTRLGDAPGRGIIIPEYSAPKDVDLPTAALLLNRRQKTTPAEIVLLAVNGNLLIRESTQTRKPTYELQFVTEEGADAAGIAYLHVLFGNALDKGETRSLTSRDEKAAKRLIAVNKSVVRDAVANGFRRKRPTGAIFLCGLIAVAGAAITALFGIAAIGEDFGGPIPAVFIVLGFAALIVSGALISKTPLEPKGVEARDYLRGLKVYISWAEEARLRFLQSPEGAEKIRVDTTDKTAVVKLNEKLLPYAVLFGNERRWAAELGKYYEESGYQPSWYFGNNAFNALYFSSALSSFSSSATSSYSSSSSGSGGGISSGGGGGGGGGGGV